MESKELDLQVGDRVTYRIIKTNEISTLIVDGDSLLDDLKRGNFIEVLKIERPKYEVVEEKKELLTDEEKEFLKDICKYYDVAKIEFFDTYLSISNNIGYVLLNPDYPKNLKFINVKEDKEYTLKELGLD